MKVAALALLALVALVCAVEAAKPAPETATASTQAGRFCHHSCYSGNCQQQLATKKALLTASGVPFVVEKTACKTAGCDALIRYSFASKELHAKYQKMEKTDPKLVATYNKAGMVSTTPKGLVKNGTCATLKGF